MDSNAFDPYVWPEVATSLVCHFLPLSLCAWTFIHPFSLSLNVSLCVNSLISLSICLSICQSVQGFAGDPTESSRVSGWAYPPQGSQSPLISPPHPPGPAHNNQPGWYLTPWWLDVFWMSLSIQNLSLFELKKIKMFLLCHYGVFCVDWWGKTTLINFRIRL